MQIQDKRSRKIVYMSNCLLNQNIRFPGIAVCGGAISELVEPMLHRGIGIEQLPCLERIGWGGVHRTSIYKMLPMLFKYSDSKLFPIIKLFGRVWFWNYRRLCKREAKKVAGQMEDYRNSGYEILGIIAMNDSPTCGATRTGDLFGSISGGKGHGLKLEDLQSPNIEKLGGLMPKVLVEGQGVFMHELLAELERRNMNVQTLGFNPWDDIKQEAERVTRAALVSQ